MLTLLLVQASVQLKAQIKINFGPEAGGFITGLPTSSEFSNNDYSSTYEFNPALSPVIGLFVKAEFQKHLFVDLGMHYTKAKTEEITFNEDYLEMRDLNFNLLLRTNYEFQKLILPIKIGYSINLNKLKISPSFGVRYNYYLTGSYKHEDLYTEIQTNVEHHHLDEYDPFDDQILKPAEKMNGGFLYGLEFYYNKKVSLNLNYCSGQNVSWSNTLALSLNSKSMFDYKDYSATLRYYLR